MAEHPTPAPPPQDGRYPTPAWAVTTGDDHDGYEVAAVFADGFDARRYAVWWNDEEIRRYGHLSARAVAEEIDFYLAGTWRPPPTSTSPRPTRRRATPAPDTPENPAVGAPTDDPPCANGSTGRIDTLEQGRQPPEWRGRQ